MRNMALELYSSSRNKKKLRTSIETDMDDMEAFLQKKIELDEKRLEHNQERFELARNLAEEVCLHNTKIMEFIRQFIPKKKDTSCLINSPVLCASRTETKLFCKIRSLKALVIRHLSTMIQAGSEITKKNAKNGECLSVLATT